MWIGSSSRYLVICSIWKPFLRPDNTGNLLILICELPQTPSLSHQGRQLSYLGRTNYSQHLLWSGPLRPGSEVECLPLPSHLCRAAGDFEVKRPKCLRPLKSLRPVFLWCLPGYTVFSSHSTHRHTSIYGSLLRSKKFGRWMQRGRQFQAGNMVHGNIDIGKSEWGQGLEKNAKHLQHCQWEVEQAVENCGEETGTPCKIGTASFKISLSVLYFEFSSQVKKKAFCSVKNQMNPTHCLICTWLHRKRRLWRFGKPSKPLFKYWGHTCFHSAFPGGF